MNNKDANQIIKRWLIQAENYQVETLKVTSAEVDQYISDLENQLECDHTIVRHKPSHSHIQEFECKKCGFRFII